MFRTFTVLALLAAGGGAAIIHAQQGSGSSRQIAPAALDRALLDQYCVTCHNDRLKTGGFSLEKMDVTQVAEHADLLEKIASKLKTGQMPPQGRPRPDQPAVAAYVAKLETALDAAAAALPNPGRVAVHRLNRLEYVNTIHDLLALDIDPALLPADNGGVGFGHSAGVRTV